MASKSSAAGSLRQRSEKLRKQLRELLRETETKALGTTEGVIDLAGALRGELVAWRTDLIDAHTKSAELLSRAEPRARAEIERFDEQLVQALTTRGYNVHGESSPLIVEGIVHIDTDLRRMKVTVNGQATQELTRACIADAVSLELERLRKSLTPPDQMMDLIARAYDQELRASGKAPGSQISAGAVMLQMALMRQSATFRSDPQSRHFRDYPRELFRADLYGLLASGRLELRQRRLQFAAGADTTGAIFMLVPSFGRAAHLGRLWFEGVQS